MRATRPLLLCLAWIALSGCHQAPPSSVVGEGAPTAGAAAPVAPSPPLVAAARAQVGVVRAYDPAYFSLTYPGGDVPADRGVCTDVVIRALRMQGLDLQQAIHEDMRDHFALYPRQWGLKAPDRNIDHRRVPNQMRWFQRQGWQRHSGRTPEDFAPSDIVAWKLAGSGLLHIGIVSDRRSADGTPLVLHNIGAGTQEDDILFQHPIIGHYRPPVTPVRG